MTKSVTTASFGYWVRRRRKALDLTQSALAQRIACATVTIVKIERDERRPSRELAELLADQLAIPNAEREKFVAAGLGEYATHHLAVVSTPIGSLTQNGNGNDPATFTLSRTKSNIAQHLYTLPPPPTPFIGRKSELDDIIRRLQDPTCRLLTLIGPGGVGKSRLAIQAAHMISESHATLFADGVCFVQLASVDLASGVVAAIAAAAHFSFYSDLPSRQQLLDFLSNKALLLVLDNIEHLLPTADLSPAPNESIWLIAEILDAAPAVKILATSRTAVYLQQAWFHLVDGMALPAKTVTDLQAWQAADAVQLFVQCGRRARVGFGVTPDYAGAVRVCRLVEGMPLAIELAASWLKTLDCAQIAEEIEHGLDLLATPVVNAPARHRSMRAVFEHSLALLAEAERSVLMRLSILRGFDLDAAVYVAGASASLLTTLVEKSLVRSPVSGRYQMHELLRQYAAEKLGGAPAEAHVTASRHGGYFLEFLHAREARLKGKDQQRALDEIDAEIDNIHAAWLWAVETDDFDALAPAVESFYEFHHVRSRFQEGEQLFARAVDRLHRIKRVSIVPDSVLCKLLAGQGVLTVELGQLDEADALLIAALTTARTLDLTREAARCLHYLGEIAARRTQLPEADSHWNASLACSERADDRAGMAEVLQTLAVHATYSGDYANAKRLAQKSLDASQLVGRPDAIAYALDKLGYVMLYLGEFVECERTYREGYAIFQAIGDQLGMSLTSGGLAMVISIKGETHRKEAFALVEESLSHANAIGHRVHIATRLVTCARVANTYGEHRLAIALNREALATAESLGSLMIAQLALSDLGYAHCQLGEFADARRSLLSALKYDESMSTFALSMALVHCGVLKLTEGRRLSGDAATDALLMALQFFIFAKRQPTITYEFNQKAARYQAELEAELPPAVVALAHARAAGMTVADVQNELL